MKISIIGQILLKQGNFTYLYMYIVCVYYFIAYENLHNQRDIDNNQKIVPCGG